MKKSAFSLVESAPNASDQSKPYATRSFLNSNNDANYRDVKHDVRSAYTNDSQGVPKSVPNKEGSYITGNSLAISQSQANFGINKTPILLASEKLKNLKIIKNDAD